MPTVSFVSWTAGSMRPSAKVPGRSHTKEHANGVICDASCSLEPPGTVRRCGRRGHLRRVQPSGECGYGILRRIRRPLPAGRLDRGRQGRQRNRRTTLLQRPASAEGAQRSAESIEVPVLRALQFSYVRNVSRTPHGSFVLDQRLSSNHHCLDIAQPKRDSPGPCGLELHSRD